MILIFMYPNPQLYQIFKPIRKLLCTFFLIVKFKFKRSLKHNKVT